MTDDDIEQAIRNAPEPPARTAPDWVAIRDENYRRHRAALDAGRCYLVGRPRQPYASLEKSLMSDEQRPTDTSVTLPPVDEELRAAFRTSMKFLNELTRYTDRDRAHAAMLSAVATDITRRQGADAAAEWLRDVANHTDLAAQLRTLQ